MPLSAPAATENGAFTSTSLYDCMRYSVTASKQYAKLEITVEPTRPIGIKGNNFLS